VFTNSKLRSLRPTSALPMNTISNHRYRRQFRKELEIIDNDYPLATFKPINEKAIISYTSKNAKERTISTNLTSIDPSKIESVSRQNNVGLGGPLSVKNKAEGKFN
jgi:hypothetical protein